MSFKQFIWMCLLSTLVAWGVWVFLLMTIDPLFATLFERSLFFLTLFIAFVGTLLLITVPIRHQFHPETILFRQVVTSFRQALLLGLLLLLGLWLLSKNLFTFWSVGILIVLLSAVEAFAQVRHHRLPETEHKKESSSAL